MTKSSKIIIALLVIILIAVLGIGVWLITDKSAKVKKIHPGGWIFFTSV